MASSAAGSRTCGVSPDSHFELDESIAYGVRVSTLLRDLEAERPVEAAVEVPE